MAASLDALERLRTAVRDSAMTVVGEQDVDNDAHVAVCVALLAAYGDTADAFLYVQPTLANSTRRPPDIVLCHPDMGLLVVEVKAWSINYIDHFEAGNFFVRRRGNLVPENPFQQCQRAMFDVKNGVECLFAGRGPLPLLEWLVAFPNLSDSEWAAAGFDECVDRARVLLAADLESPGELRRVVADAVHDGLDMAGLTVPLRPDRIPEVRRVFGSSAVLAQERDDRRLDDSDDRLGAIVDTLASVDKHLSDEQETLSRLEVAGFPRLIRGVAGSGKTVVLANMAARFINRHLEGERQLTLPDPEEEEAQGRPKVAVLCFNRSLVEFIHQRIRVSYREQTRDAVPADVLHVSHLNGLMYELSQTHGLPYVRTGEVRDSSERARRYLDAIASLRKRAPERFDALRFDAIFLDEGQDFEPAEYRLIHELVKPANGTGERSLVIFYDDAQNLYGRSRPVWAQLGIDVQRGNRARVMRRCFRNSRQVVEFGFNVLLGTCASRKVQMRQFADIGFLRERDLVREDEDGFLHVSFAEREGQHPTIRTFPSRAEEFEAILERLRELIADELVRPEDLLVLFTRKETCDAFIRRLERHAVKDLVMGLVRPYGGRDDVDEYIFRQDHLTVSTVQGAKGYDSWVTLLCGIDELDDTDESRARFYVGATRAKLALEVSGLAGALTAEAERVLERMN